MRFGRRPSDINNNPVMATTAGRHRHRPCDGYKHRPSDGTDGLPSRRQTQRWNGSPAELDTDAAMGWMACRAANRRSDGMDRRPSRTPSDGTGHRLSSSLVGYRRYLLSFPSLFLFLLNGLQEYKNMYV